MKKVIRSVVCIFIFLLFLIICGNTKSVYALTAEEVKSLTQGDTLEVTTSSKVYYYGYIASGKDVMAMQLMPGYEETHIPVGTLLSAMKSNGSKCYRLVNGVYYVSVNWGHVDCYVHFHNLKKKTISQEDKNKATEFLKKENVKKITNGKAGELDDKELIDIAKEAQSIFLKTANEDVNQVEQKALLELQERGYTYNVRSDGSVEITDSEGNNVGELEGGDQEASPDTAIYQLPKKDPVDDSQEKSLDDMMNDADNFISQGTTKYNETALQNFSKTMYNILLAVGVAIAVIIGGIIGIKLMTASVEEKAQVKELLVPYVVGCIVVFGGFAIWKLVVTILEGM